MSRPIITLTTDFGSSHYVGQLKGVLAGMAPEAIVMDLTHSIQPQAILEGAIVLQDSVPHFPLGSIHIAVVDPGVGTSRGLIAAEIGDWTFIGPDNGLFSGLLQDWPLRRVVRLNQPRWWRSQVSHTFHGRDIMAPVAAHLANGEPLESFGVLQTDVVKLEIPVPQVETVVTAQDEITVKGETLIADSYGNMLTNIRRERLLQVLELEQINLMRVEVENRQNGERTEIDFVHTYGEREPGTLIALFGSSGRLELGIVNGNAAKIFPLGATVLASC